MKGLLEFVCSKTDGEDSLTQSYRSQLELGQRRRPNQQRPWVFFSEPGDTQAEMLKLP